ncbi:hypothetical protein FY034_17610 (plasmid) [Trichlorobacter lovleyi]|uniref:hypothetical protein n=1 Tax=Trichlorobacter lovleyi TaxID=313985 RepID=UPI00223EEDAC|nr:hypothetical protein [Trichlorobacter lovleyi]QOX80841.1 hypothetical protein FY034_17610 [Trichlorobacter lovleyi]
MAFKWWEKTVEYLFVLVMHQEGKMFLAPLDGPEERAGDAIFSRDNRWALIEFKKDESSIKDEWSKFHNFEQAKVVFEKEDNHHFLVYGLPVEKGKELKLMACTYFSARYTPVTKIVRNGEKFSEFLAYVKAFIKWKKGPDSGPGGLDPILDNSVVAGISTEGIIVECISLSDFLIQAGEKTEPNNEYFTAGA